MRNLQVVGNLWQRIMAPLCTPFSGFCCSKSLEDFCGLIFCEILSEVLKIWKRRQQALSTCCHFSLHCGSDAGCSNRRVTAFRLEGQKVDGEPLFFCFSALNAIFYFQTSVQTSLTLSAFEFAKI